MKNGRGSWRDRSRWQEYFGDCSGTQIKDVNVDARVDVIEQIPADVIGIVIDHEVIAAIPAPVTAQAPIPGGDLKVKAAGKPKAVMVAVDAEDAITIAGAHMSEMAVRERMVHVIALVVGIIVAIPMVVADVRCAVHIAVELVLLFAFVLLVRRRLGRRRGNMPLVGARNVLLGSVLMLIGMWHRMLLS